MNSRLYAGSTAAVFQFQTGAIGNLSLLSILPNPIPAGPWLFRCPETLHQAARFPHDPRLQQEIAALPSGSLVNRCVGSRSAGNPNDANWARQRHNVMRCGSCASPTRPTLPRSTRPSPKQAAAPSSTPRGATPTGAPSPTRETSPAPTSSAASGRSSATISATRTPWPVPPPGCNSSARTLSGALRNRPTPTQNPYGTPTLMPGSAPSSTSSPTIGEHDHPRQPRRLHPAPHRQPSPVRRRRCHTVLPGHSSDESTRELAEASELPETSARSQATHKPFFRAPHRPRSLTGSAIEFLSPS